jgi:hypothetical protein
VSFGAVGSSECSAVAFIKTGPDSPTMVSDLVEAQGRQDEKSAVSSDALFTFLLKFDYLY